MWKHGKLILVAAGLTVLAGGCEVTPRLELVSSNLYVTEKKDVAVAIVIPETTRAFSTLRDLPSACLGEITFIPVPYGEIFEQTLRDRFSRVFVSTGVVPALSQAERAEAVFEATLSDLGYRIGCPISPETYIEIKASLRAVDRGGRELWRNRAATFRHNAALLVWDADAEIGRNVSTAIAALVDGWTQEILQLPPQAYGVEGLPAAVATARTPSAGRAPAAVAPAAAPPRFPAATLALRFPKGPERPDDVAVVIGNADYGKLGKDIPNVKPAYADAESFKRYLTESLGLREGNVIDLRDATGSQLVRVFGSKENHRGQLYDWVRPNRSRVYVYYSGHGAPAGSDGSAFLVPADSDANRIDLNGYPLSTRDDNLAKLPTPTVTVVLEACFSGASQGGAVISNASPVYLKPKAPPVPANLTVIAAGGANQMASWEEDGSNGLFTKYYLKGMAGEADAKPFGNGDGKVEIKELEAYLRDTLTYYARRYYGRDQTAQITSGEGR